jgi:hypothetical protein
MEGKLKILTVNFLLVLSFVVCLSGIGCSYMTHKPEGMTVLSTQPMGNTSVSSYLPIETLYKSDRTICLIARWGGAKESENHRTQWEILDSTGKKIYSSSRDNVTIRSHMYTITQVTPKEFLAAGSHIDQLTANFFIDDELVQSKKIHYKNQSITSTIDQQVIILPFVEENIHPTPWGDGAKTFFQNTIADAIYCEVKRVFPETIPHYVVEQKVSRHLDPYCLKDESCKSFLKNVFGENIFIYGNLSIQKVDLDTSTLTVFVYNMKTDKLKKFHFFHPYDFSFPSLMQDLLAGIFYKEGMLDFLMKM